MALFKSNILASASGSLNGIVFSHNRGGSYMRNRSIPINPGTDRQDAVRTAMTSIATTWKNTLTAGQRDGWRNYGASLSIINKLGDPTSLSGIAAFQRVNLFRMSTLGLPITQDAPSGTTMTSPPTFSSFAASFDDPGSSYLVSLNSAGTGFSLAWYLNANVSPGIKYFRGPYPQRGTGAGGLTTDISFSSTTTPIALPANGAAKLTLYHTASNLPIWTVFTDAIPIVL